MHHCRIGRGCCWCPSAWFSGAAAEQEGVGGVVARTTQQEQLGSDERREVSLSLCPSPIITKQEEKTIKGYRTEKEPVRILGWVQSKSNLDQNFRQNRSKALNRRPYPTAAAVSSLTNLCHKFCAELGSVGQWRALLNTKGTKWSLADACCATAWAATTRRRRPPKMCEIRMAQNQMVVVVEEEGISSMTRRTKGGQRMLQQRHYLPKVCLARRVEVGRSGHAKVRNRRR